MDFYDKLGRFMGMVLESRVGFKFDEKMVGTNCFCPDSEYIRQPERVGKIELCLSWGPKELSDWINVLRRKTTFRGDVKGLISVDDLTKVNGFEQAVRCEGVVDIDYSRNHSIQYELEFFGSRRDFVYIGTKRGFFPVNIHSGNTACLGEIRDYESKELISTSVARFEFSNLSEMLKSFRFE